jgi:hypothetical protein
MQLPGDLQPDPGVPGGPAELGAGAAAAAAPVGPAAPIALPVIVARRLASAPARAEPDRVARRAAQRPPFRAP